MKDLMEDDLSDLEELEEAITNRILDLDAQKAHIEKLTREKEAQLAEVHAAMIKAHQKQAEAAG